MADILTTEQTGNCAVGVLNVRGEKQIARNKKCEDFYFVTQNAPIDSSRIHGVLQKAFETTAKKFKQKYVVGSTASVAIVTPDNYITTAHLGDSPIALFVRDTKTGDMTAHQLTKSHDFDNKEERMRVIDAGGRFDGQRLANDIASYAITRAFGDRIVKAMSDEPDIGRFKISDYAKPEDQVFLCVATDGVFDPKKGLPPSDYTTLIANAYSDDKKANIEQEIVKRMETRAARKSRDDKTVLFMEIPRQGLTQSLILGVCDGHDGTEVAQQAAKSLKEELSKPITPQLPGRSRA